MAAAAAAAACAPSSKRQGLPGGAFEGGAGAQGMTQRELEAASGVPQGKISRIERGSPTRRCSQSLRSLLRSGWS
ncbi:MAG: XRE family transcriptional regulator [Microbacterium sp.]|nr:MAG: XRE family transcriptional regulator [Microbacterium sp.]